MQAQLILGMYCYLGREVEIYSGQCQTISKGTRRAIYLVVYREYVPLLHWFNSSDWNWGKILCGIAWECPVTMKIMQINLHMSVQLFWDPPGSYFVSEQIFHPSEYRYMQTNILLIQCSHSILPLRVRGQGYRIGPVRLSFRLCVCVCVCQRSHDWTVEPTDQRFGTCTYGLCVSIHHGKRIWGQRN